MNTAYRTVVVVAMMILMTNPVLLAWGNPPPGRWEKVSQTEPGQKMIIYTSDGAKSRYGFRSLDNRFLHCVNEQGGEVQIELVTVKEIVIPQAVRYAAWGSLIGAGGGAGLMGVIYRDSSDGPYYPMIGGALIGAVSGLLAGAAIGAPGETVYISKEAALDK